MGAVVTEQLTLMAAHHGGRVGFVDLGTGERLTYAAWSAESCRLGRGLRAAGVATGDRVAVYLPDTSGVRWVEAYAAVHQAGAVAVPVNTRLVARELAGILAHAGATAAVVGATLWSALAAVVADLPELGLVVLDGDPGPSEDVSSPPGSAGPRTVAWDDVVAGQDPSPLDLDLDVDADDLADIVYTSGTTGRPKGVVVRHANASPLPSGVPVWGDSGWLSASPLFTFAGITAVYTPMKLGLTSLHLPRFTTGAWIRAVEAERPSIVFLVPAMAELLLADPALATADLSSIGLCAVGSAPLAPVTQRRLAAALPAAAVSNAYGMTEAGPAYTVLPREEADRRAGSVGRPLEPADFFAIDEQGRRLGPDQVGELVISLPGRQREYYRDPEATAAAWHGDGLHTGDLARIDADGYVYVVGRAKEVIIRGGHNVHAADVEAVLHEHPDVVEAVVAGVAHPVLGEDVAAWVVTRDGSDLDDAGLIDWAAGRLADYKLPRRVAVVDRLPRNATGKVVKADLVEPPPPPGREHPDP